MEKKNQIDWFYNLPSNEDGNFILTPPKGSDFDFLVEIQSTSISGVDYFLIQYTGRDWILGLAMLFMGFTGRFQNGSAGYSDGIIPFAVRFDNGVQALLFDLFMKLRGFRISYYPVFLLYQSKKVQVWYFN